MVLTVHHEGKAGQEPGDKDHGGTLLPALYPRRPSAFCFGSYTQNLLPGVAPPAADWTLTYKSFIKKMAPQTFLPIYLMEAFSQLKRPLPDNSNLCQVNKKTSQHTAQTSYRDQILAVSVSVASKHLSYLGHETLNSFLQQLQFKNKGETISSSSFEILTLLLLMATLLCDKTYLS